MRTYKIFLIRHGITKANLEGRYVGWTDSDLCEEGIAEILLLKEQYEYPNVGCVYASPLKRALQTARLIYPDITPTTVENLKECHFGEYEGKLLADLKDRPEFLEWFKGGRKIASPGGESMAIFQKRIVEGFNEVVLDMMKNKVSEAAIVTHGGVIMDLLALCGLPKQPSTAWSVKNGTGYTALVSASLWGNNKSFEIFTPIPYGTKTEEIMMDYQKAFFNEE